MSDAREDSLDVLAPLARAFASEPSVTVPDGTSTKFGSRGLRVREKIFAMQVDGALVLKLPASRVDALVHAGRATRLEMRGRAMKEWAVLACEPDAAIELAREAMAFVRGR